MRQAPLLLPAAGVTLLCMHAACTSAEMAEPPASGTPAVSGIPAVSETPAAPSAPAVSETPAAPSTPAVSETPAASGASSAPPGRALAIDVSSPWKWGPVKKDHCSGEGLRQVSSRLWNIPSGMDWDDACQRAPRNVMGIDFERPDRCVDLGPSGEWGEWDVPDTSCLSSPPPAPVRGETGVLASSAPLEGYADLHVHQMGHLGFGGSVLWGGAYGPPESVLTAIPSAMKPGHDRTEALFQGDYLGGLFGASTHPEAGYPGFTSWPSRALATHQQAYEDWLFRAYVGGLRLMVMLAVNSEDMFGRGENDIPLLGGTPIQEVKAPGRSGNDMEALEWQVREAYRMQADIDARHGGPGRGWYRIVRDPEEASRVIAEGKLAVVLGTELQHLFNCDVDRPACSEETVVEGLNRLEGMGVSYVFPIHHKLNQFGGAAQFNVLTSGPTEDCIETNEPCAATGLTDLGRFLVEELTARGMLIDTEHMSWKALGDALDIAEARGYPVLASHVGAFNLQAGDDQREQQRRADQLRRIFDLGGMVGVILGTSAEEYAPSAERPVQVPISCGGADAWANTYLFLKDLAGGALRDGSGMLTLGSDWNGFAAWASPRYGASPCQPRRARHGQPIPKPAQVSYPLALPPGLVPAAIGGTPSLPRLDWMRPWDYNAEGLMHAGLMPEFLEDLRLTGLTLAELEPLYRSARGVVELWRRARRLEVPGDRHHLRWVPSSPFDVLPFEYPDRARYLDAGAGLSICRSRQGHRLGFEQDGKCRLVEDGAGEDAPREPAAQQKVHELAPVALTAYHAGRCLDVSGASTANGANVHQWTCNGGSNQRWQLRSDDGAQWQLVAVHSGKCLEIAGASQAEGASARQATCSNAASQAWRPVRSGNTFRLQAVHSGQCLEVKGEGRADGSDVVQSSCDGASQQQWSIPSLRGEDYERLYQADMGEVAWQASGSGRYVLPVTVDGTREICRSRTGEPWLGVVSGSVCRGRTYAGDSASTGDFERLMQAR